jgi:predicted enzyme related to lactoylglutathione lyase
MRVSETIYFTQDFPAAVEFYQTKLGWQLEEKLDWGWATFRVEGGTVGLLDAAKWGESDGLPVPILAFRTDDLDAELERMRAQGVRFSEVKQAASGLRSTVFSDADGNKFFLWQE